MADPPTYAEHRKAMAELGIGELIHEAFKVPNNVILFAGGVLAGLVVLNPLAIWPFVAAAEIVYLATRSHSARFQALVVAKRLRALQTRSTDVVEKLVALLDPKRQDRFTELKQRCLELQTSMAGAAPADTVTDLLASQQTESVNKLLWVFLRTLAQEKALADFCAAMPRGDIEGKIATTERDLAQAGISDKMKAAYQENVDVLKKRLDNLHRAEENLKSLQARLVRVENSVLLIQEQALTRRDPAFIEAEVSSATAGLDSLDEMLRGMDLPPIQSVGEGQPVPQFMTLGGEKETA